MNKQVSEAAIIAGSQTLIPLSLLLKSPRNARKANHSPASIEAKAASIAAKGILQNLVVEPELDLGDQPTGNYFVTIGEGRRLAQLLRVERGEITTGELIPCVIDITNDPHEISLDENVTREDMHPADQFEAFRFLNEVRGLSAEDIAARFGVTARTVQQRLRLGAVSPRLMQAYRDEALTLDQLMAFAVTEDHTRQETVYDGLNNWQREPYHIRRLLTAKQVRAEERRARFVGAETYVNCGGHIERDLFTEDGDGYFTDPVLLDKIAVERMTAIAVGIQGAEGWKWAEAYIDFPYSNAYRRAYPKVQELSAEDAVTQATDQSELLALSEEWKQADELPPEVDARMSELEADIARYHAMTTAYDPDDIARGGVIVSLTSDGQAKVERGLFRMEDLKADPEQEADEDGEDMSAKGGDGGDFRDDQGAEDDDEIEPNRPLADGLVRDLTAHRTAALRLTLGEQPELAARALAYTLVLDIFYGSRSDSCLEIRTVSVDLAGWVDDYSLSPAVEALQVRHDAWAAQLPGTNDLWPYLVTMDPEDLGLLIAHCVALTVNAVRQPHERRPGLAFADTLATAMSLDMGAYWRPTARRYFERVTKGHILDAVREAIGGEAAERLTPHKKQPMAEAAEQLVAATGWLPAILRTPPTQEPEAEGTDQPGLPTDPDAEHLPEAAE